MAAVLDSEARIRLAGGDLPKALSLAEQALKAAEATGNQKAVTDARLKTARIAAQAGELGTAIGADTRGPSHPRC